MDTFNAIVFTEKEIVLDDVGALDTLYETILSEKPFILNWVSDGEKQSQVLMSNNFASKVKNGEIILKAKTKEIKKC